MKKLVAMVLLGVAFASCSKKTVCTTEDQSKWQDQESFKAKLVEEGFKINEFKVTEGSCYEIYGRDKDQNKVEIYFNPVDGAIVKKENH